MVAEAGTVQRRFIPAREHDWWPSRVGFPSSLLSLRRAGRYNLFAIRELIIQHVSNMFSVVSVSVYHICCQGP